MRKLKTEIHDIFLFMLFVYYYFLPGLCTVHVCFTATHSSFLLDRPPSPQPSSSSSSSFVFLHVFALLQHIVEIHGVYLTAEQKTHTFTFLTLHLIYYQHCFYFSPTHNHKPADLSCFLSVQREFRAAALPQLKMHRGETKLGQCCTCCSRVLGVLLNIPAKPPLFSCRDIKQEKKLCKPQFHVVYISNKGTR